MQQQPTQTPPMPSTTIQPSLKHNPTFTLVTTLKKDTKQQQYTMRDDVIQLSYDIVHSARNHFRKRGSFAAHNKNVSGDFGKIGGGKVEEQGQDASRYSKRDVFTSANSKSSRTRGSGSFKISKTQSMQMEKINKIKPNLTSQTPISSSQELLQSQPQPQPQPQPQSQPHHYHQNLFQSFLHSSSTPAQPISSSSFKALQQKHNKYCQKDSSVQSWLNQALIQASPNVVFDKNQQNAGLKIYNIDRSSLIKVGLHADHVSRLFRSLFVYSLGFNNLLGELCGKSNKMLRNNIWKAFAVLLQYCSGGNFSTTIGQIQRDKQSKLALLRTQIQSRQKQLQSYDQQSQKKNMKILKQYRELQNQKKQLQQQRDVILQDFHQAEQAFNQEIALRLKYQTRINQIHGVYEELSQKYRLAKEELEKYGKDMGVMRGTVAGLREELGVVRLELQAREVEIGELKSQLMHVSEQNSTLQQTAKTTTQSYLTSKHQTQLHVQSLSNQSRTISNMTHQLNNNKSTAQSLFQTLQSKSQQFQKAMNQNKELHAHIQRDTQHINQLLQQLRQVRNKQGEVQARVEVQRRKIQERQSAVKAVYQRVEELEMVVREKDVEIRSQVEKRIGVEKDLENCYVNIREMKAVQSRLTEELQAQKNLTIMQYQKMGELKQSMQKLQLQLQNSSKKIHTLTIQISHLKSTITVLQQQKATQKQSLSQTIQKSQLELQKQRDKTKSLLASLKKSQQQLQTSKLTYDKTYTQLKNQRFQRNNLQLYYKQSLTMMEEQIAHIKKLSIEISELKECLDSWKRKYAVLESVYEGRVGMLEADVSMWKKCYQQTQRKQRQRRVYVHPMVVQDLQSQIQQLTTTITQQSQHLTSTSHKLKQLQQQKTSLQQSQLTLQLKSTQQIHTNYNKKIQTLNQQLSYVSQKLAYKQEELVQVGKQVAKLREDVVGVGDYARNKQKQYMSIINDKNKQISQLNQKYRNLLDIGQKTLKTKQKQPHNTEQHQLKQRIAKLQQQLKAHTQQQHHRQKQQQHHRQQQHAHSPLKIDKTKKQHITNHNHNNNHSNNHDHDHDEQTEDKAGWHNDRNEEQSQLQKLDSKQQRGGGEIGEGEAVQKSEDNYKKRQQMSKKIKGAYLYYLK